MKTANTTILPMKVRRALRKLGRDINVARRKRRLTVDMMAERVGTSKSTYLRLEKGEPTVAMGIYAMALFVLGLDNVGDLADPGTDDAGILIEEERLPARVRLSVRREKAEKTE